MGVEKEGPRAAIRLQTSDMQRQDIFLSLAVPLLWARPCGFVCCSAFFSPSIIISLSLYSLPLSLLSLGLSICWQFSGFSVCCCDGWGFQIRGKVWQARKKEKNSFHSSAWAFVSIDSHRNWKKAIYIAFCSWLYFNNSMRWNLSFWKPYTGLLRLWKFLGILKL